MDASPRPGPADRGGISDRLNSRVSLVGGGALVLLLVFASQLYVWINLWPMTVSWGEAVLLAVPHLVVWSLLFPVIAELSRRFPIRESRPVLGIGAHLMASVVVSMVALGLIDVSDELLHWTRFLGAPSTLVADFKITAVHLHLGIGIYWVVVAVTHALRYYDVSRETEIRASRLEAQLAQAELQALRMQLNPHFLFNALNSIDVLLRNDPAAARVMLHRLADLLQTTLRHDGSNFVPLRDELRHLRSYLQIEETRFGARLTVEWDVPEGLDREPVPFLILQPLVENAIRHGVGPETGPGHLRVAASEDDGALSLVVEDDGAGLPAGFGPSAYGVGLSNTELRLERLYGDDAHLRVEGTATGTRVEVRIPRGRDAPRGTESVAAVSGP